MYKKIPNSFYKQDVQTVAKRLLGQLLVFETEEATLVGRIVETEAYEGAKDQAAHTFNELRTDRTEVLFGEPGYVYAYKMHTHILINVSVGEVDEPHAVLIRAVEPVTGWEKIRANRSTIKQDHNLTNGPGKLTKAFGITQQWNGHSWRENPLYLAVGKPVTQIGNSPRIGVSGAGEAADYPYRYFEKGNKYVSKFRK